MREKIGTVVTIGLTINLLAWTLIGFAYVAAVWGPFALLGLLTALLLVLFVATLPRGVRDDDF